MTDPDIERALAGELPYDSLDAGQQACVPAARAQAFDDDLTRLDLRATFEAEGRMRWSEARTAGTVVVHRQPAPS